MIVWWLTACLTTFAAPPTGIGQTMAEFRAFLPEAQRFIEDLDGRVSSLDRLWDPQARLNHKGNALNFRSRLKLRLVRAPYVTDKILSLPAVIAQLKQILNINRADAQTHLQELTRYRGLFQRFIQENEKSLDTPAKAEDWLLVNRYVLYSEVGAANVKNFLTYIDFLEAMMPDLVRQVEVLHHHLQKVSLQEPVVSVVAAAAAKVPLWLPSLVSLVGTSAAVYGLMSLPWYSGLGLAAGITVGVNTLFYIFHPLLEEFSLDRAEHLKNMRQELLHEFTARWLEALRQIGSLKKDFQRSQECRELLGGELNGT